MGATKLFVSLTLLYITEIQLVKSQAIGCQGYGYCGGYCPTVVDTIDNNDPLDIILPVLLLAICNRAGSNCPTPVNAYSVGLTETIVAPRNGCGCNSGCNGGCNSGCNGGCNTGCNSACNGGYGGTYNGCCNSNPCSGPIVVETPSVLSNPCCGSCGCC